MFRLFFSGFVVLLSFLVLPGACQAQRAPHTSPIPLQINGQIRYAQGGRPAEFILVRLESFRGGVEADVTTDRSGKFTFIGLSPEMYVVLVRTPGFREVSQQVDLRTQITDYVQLMLVTDENSAPASNRTGVIDANVPHGALTEFEKGRDALLRANNAAVGILHLENAVRIYPRYFEALLLLGTAYMDQSNWDKAQQTLARALGIYPKAANALFALGELYLKQKKDGDAEKVLLQGLQFEDRSWQSHLTLGHVYWNMAAKFTDEAHYRPLLEKSYVQAKRALELKPDLAAGHLLKGNLLFKARRAEDALHEFEEYVRLDPNAEFVDQTRALIQKIKTALAAQKRS
ncbi:MAG TPA: tetratricopeptide repeat protein [Pyrinomonadaceae bacterium]|nr:tetratricopeptide repeat protein [Pyrinomonadaceae bacterium]